jgi:hypothetical protein
MLIISILSKKYVSHLCVKHFTKVGIALHLCILISNIIFYEEDIDARKPDFFCH